MSYPSDPQLIGANRILLADYAKPGAAIIMTRTGRVLWRYGPQSGPGELDHPSLATQIAPGLIAINDDFRDRVVIVNLRTKRIVWQYGHTDVAGRGPGYLNTPDGLDLLPTHDAQSNRILRRLFLPRQAAPATHTGARSVKRALRVTVPFSLAAPVEREIAVGDGRSVIVAGGLDAAGSSTSGVFRLNPTSGRLTALGSFPSAFHDAAGAIIGSSLFAFGGGAAASSANVQRFNLATHRSSIVAQLPYALSDLAAATTSKGTYLIGGFDGNRPRPEIYRTRDGTSFTRVARLPTGLRYPAVASLGRLLVIAGGVDKSGTSRAVYVLDTATNNVRLLGTLPRGVAHAEAFVLGRDVYVAGGADAAGHTVSTVAAIDPAGGTIRPVAGKLPIRDAAAAAVDGSVLLIGGAAAAGATAAVHRVARR